MTRRSGEYTRLARGIFGVSSLWLGPRDLLYVRGVGVVLACTEEYHRFALDRIQSASVVRTPTGWILNLVFGAVAVVGGAVAAAAWWLSGGAAGGGPMALWYLLLVPAGGIGVIALGLLLVNCLLGPTCRFQLQTATRLERLRPLGRLRPARRVLAQLTPVLLAAQSGGPRDQGGAGV